MADYIMALDAGTTSSRCILFDRSGRECGMAQQEFNQIFPRPGWVEHDPNEIWQTQLSVARKAINQMHITFRDIAAIGIANQRETVILWDRRTGQPVCNAIVWQCRRTADDVERIKAEHPEYPQIFRDKTGLILDPYFSGTKIRWILDHVDGVLEKAQRGDLCFGTVDSWLIYKLTKGRVHVTDYSNASRTLLFNIHTLSWDEELCNILEIPASILPEVKPSSCIYGETDPEFFGGPIPIAGAAGDQQAALFGQNCLRPGEAKNTYGTGCFTLMNIGNTPLLSASGLLTTIAWGLNNEITYALEGSVYVAGAAIQWLRDEMDLIDSSSDSEYFATRVPDTNGCYVVPAFTGLGAPYWDPYARGVITGLTRGVSKCHLIRATLESIAFQSYDVLHTMEADAGIRLRTLKVDGGASRNNFLMQFQADIANTEIQRPRCVETTALGAACLAGLAVSHWSCTEEITDNWTLDRAFLPQMSSDRRRRELAGWKKAVSASRGWAREY
ncbi:MAG: glycerol kinase GlpK [Lachnospiraceae bacterium]|jgi:glycerol kinase|nr:glycerol kinase GlpK [Lachnospiraceae bacterium]MCI2196166.1 glycerol kinase GlpK [Lachnospiraceae bacterium]